MRRRIILRLQRFLSERYNKHIVEIQNPFRDMRVLLAAKKIINIVDAGAYVGEISKNLLTLFPDAQIYAFEPTQATYLKLKENIIGCSHIRPQNVALSSRKGSAILYHNRQDSANALSATGPMGKKYQSWQTETLSTEKVTLIPLDYWANKNKVESVEVLKMDVQGHELEVLKGATKLLKSSIRLIYTEVEFVKIYKNNCLFSEIDMYLSKFGFKLFQLYNLTSGDDKRLVTGDAIFIHEDRVVL